MKLRSTMTEQIKESVLWNRTLVPDNRKLVELSDGFHFNFSAPIFLPSRP